MAKTRAELQAAINYVLEDPEYASITAEQIREILIDISDSMFVSEDDYTYPAEVETLNITSTTLGLKVAGVKVVGEQGTAIGFANEDTPSLSEAVGKINALISALGAHGLIEPNP